MTEESPLQPTQALILAAGKGTRMKSDLPKVLHVLGNKPLIHYVLDAVSASKIENVTVVIGHEHNLVEKSVKEWAENSSLKNIQFQVQSPQEGTGHAVMICREKMENLKGYLVVLLGDVPMIRSETVSAAINEIKKQNASMLVISTKLKDPHGYGRILRDKDGKFLCIKEEKEASDEEKMVNEVNTGAFVFKSEDLWKYISQLKNHNSQKEYFLTDMVEILLQNDKKVSALLFEENSQFLGINSKDQLNSLEKELGITA